MHQIDPKLTALQRFRQLRQRIQVTMLPLRRILRTMLIDDRATTRQSTKTKVRLEAHAQMRADKAARSSKSD